jgi:integrase
MIASCLDKVVERGAPVLARNMLGDLRQMFGFAIKREYVENDPTSHLKRDDFGKKIERDRVLNDDEIKALNKLLQAAGMQEASVAAIWIMLSTCCRVGEISRARWVDIDLKTDTWRIPPDNAKNGKEHIVFLSEFSARHFKKLNELATNDLGKLSTWAMPASQKDSHVCVKSLAKQIGDRQRGADSKPMSNRTRLTSALILPRGKWTPHDLRRTGPGIRHGSRSDRVVAGVAL